MVRTSDQQVEMVQTEEQHQSRHGQSTYAKPVRTAIYGTVYGHQLRDMNSRMLTQKVKMLDGRFDRLEIRYLQLYMNGIPKVTFPTLSAVLDTMLEESEGQTNE